MVQILSMLPHLHVDMIILMDLQYTEKKLSQLEHVRDQPVTAQQKYMIFKQISGLSDPIIPSQLGYFDKFRYF